MSLQPPKLNKEIEKRFDEKFLDIKAELNGQHPKDFWEQFDFEIIEMFKEFLATELETALAEQRREIIKKHIIEVLERLKLEFDVVVCDCGEEWKETDAADIIKQSLSDAIKEVEKM